MTNKPDSKTLALQLIETADRQDWPRMYDLVAPSVKVHIGSQGLDPDGWKAFGQMFYAAFPDAKHAVEAAHLSGEYATVVATFTGTHKAPFMGIPATGKRIGIQVIHVDRFVDGRCVEHLGQLDSAGMMQALTGPAPDLRPLADTLFQRIDAQDFAGVFAMMTPEFRFRIGGQQLDSKGWSEFSRMFFGAFPDGKHVHDEVVTAGDRCTVTGNFTGTHRGNFQGIPATGRQVSISYVGIGRFVGDRIGELRVEIDSAGLMQQLA